MLSSALCSAREELFELAAPGSLLRVVIPTQVLPIDEDIWHRALTGDTLEGGLYLGAVCKFVELDVRGLNAHLLEETPGPANSSTRDRVRCGCTVSGVDALSTLEGRVVCGGGVGRRESGLGYSKRLRTGCKTDRSTWSRRGPCYC